MIRYSPRRKNSIRGLMQKLQLEGRVVRPKSLDDLLDKMEEEDLKMLLKKLKALQAKRQRDNTQDQDGSKCSVRDLSLAAKQDETIEKLEAMLGVPSGSMLYSFDKLQDLVFEEYKKLKGDVSHSHLCDLKLACTMLIWTLVVGLRTVFSSNRDIVDELGVPPSLHKNAREAWENLRQDLMHLYIRSPINISQELPKVLLSIPDADFLRRMLRKFSAANSQLDETDNFHAHLNATFVPINEPSKSSRAVVELLLQTVRDVSAREKGVHMFVATTDQLFSKDSEASMKRLRIGMQKNGQASIICKDTEESLNAMLKTACSLRLGHRLASGNEANEVLAIPIMRPEDMKGSLAASTCASHSKQVAKAMRLSALVPEGYRYRVIMLAYLPSAQEQALDSMRAHLELKLKEGGDVMHVSKEELEWKQRMRFEAENKAKHIRSMAGGGIPVPPYVKLISISDRVDNTRKQAIEYSASGGSKKDVKVVHDRQRRMVKQQEEHPTTLAGQALKVTPGGQLPCMLELRAGDLPGKLDVRQGEHSLIWKCQ